MSDVVSKLNELHVYKITYSQLYGSCAIFLLRTKDNYYYAICYSVYLSHVTKSIVF